MQHDLRNHLRERLDIPLRTFRLFSDIEGEQRAASFAYYALFSIFPLVALLLTLGSTFFNPQEVIEAIHRFAPVGDAQQQLIWQMVGNLERARGSVSLISIAILLWASLRFFQSLVRAVNRAWHTVNLPWWQVPLKNLGMVAILASALLLGIVTPAIMQGIHQAVQIFESWIDLHIPHLDIGHWLSLIDWSRYIVSSLVLFYSFLMLYKMAPRRKITLRQVWFPALLVTVLLQVLQNVFVNYLPHFIQYNVIYGTVGGMMFLLLWIYITGTIIILGGCLCAVLDQVRTERIAAIGTTPSNSEY